LVKISRSFLTTNSSSAIHNKFLSSLKSCSCSLIGKIHEKYLHLA
jgi:hypothetical protein